MDTEYPADRARQRPIPSSYAHIQSNPKICGGKPCIQGTRIRVQDIALWHERIGLSADEIVSRFPQVTLSAVYSALSYYHEHRDEIRLDLEAADQLVQEARHKYPSPLRARLLRAE